jgi:hypothetical protein
MTDTSFLNFKKIISLKIGVMEDFHAYCVMFLYNT